MKSILFCYLLLMSFVLHSQNWIWTKSYSDNIAASSGNNLIGLDKNGKIYIAGFIAQYTGDAGGANNTYPIFYKIATDGTLLLKDTLSHSVSGMVTDEPGNTYMVNTDKIYKYDSTGLQIWAKSLPGKTLRSICLNPLGGISVYGWGYMGNGNTSALAQLDVNGNFSWIRNGDFVAGGSLPDPVVCDNAGNTYATVISGTKGLLISIPANGNSITTYSITDWPQLMTLSANQSIYIAGKTPNPGNSTSRFIRKYTANGNLRWSAGLNSNYLEVYSLKSDKHDNINIAGIFYKNLSVGTVSVSCSAYEMFLACVDSSGNTLWIKTSTGPATLNGSSNGMPAPNSMILNSLNEIFIAGQMTGQHSFDNTTVNCDQNYPDLFLCKLTPALTTALQKQESSNNNLAIYPSPTHGMFNIEFEPSNSNIRVTIINSAGQRVYSEANQKVNGPYNKVFDLSALPKGIYFVEVNTGKERTVKKIVLE